MLVKWLIKVSNYLRGWGSLPSDKVLSPLSQGCGSQELRQEAKGSLTLILDVLLSHPVQLYNRLVTPPSSRALRVIDCTADHRARKIQSVTLYFIQWGASACVCAVGTDQLRHRAL